MQIQDISPLITTTEQQLLVELPKKTKIKGLVSVDIHYNKHYVSQLDTDITDLKKHVSVDTGCSIKEIKVIDSSE